MQPISFTYNCSHTTDYVVPCTFFAGMVTSSRNSGMTGDDTSLLQSKVCMLAVQVLNTYTLCRKWWLNI